MMTNLQKTLFLFSLAALIGSTAFNGSYFILNNQNAVAAAIQINKNLNTSTKLLPVPTKRPLEVTTRETPTDVKAAWVSRENGSEAIVVTWKGTASGSNGYSIYRKAARDSRYIHLKDVSAAVTTLVDKNVRPNITYTYKVKTWKSGFSAESTPTRIGSKEKRMETVFGEIQL